MITITGIVLAVIGLLIVSVAQCRDVRREDPATFRLVLIGAVALAMGVLILALFGETAIIHPG